MSQGDSENLCVHPPPPLAKGERGCLVIGIKVLTSCGVLRLSVRQLISFASFSFHSPLGGARVLSGGGGAAAAAHGRDSGSW